MEAAERACLKEIKKTAKQTGVFVRNEHAEICRHAVQGCAGTMALER